MNKYAELLNRYRADVLDLYEMEAQLSRLGTDGRPAGYGLVCLDREGGRTNDPAAAARQIAEGLEELIGRKKAEMLGLNGKLQPVLNQIPDIRTRMIVQQYYLCAATDESIAQLLMLSPQRVHQLRHRYLKGLNAMCLEGA